MHSLWLAMDGRGRFRPQVTLKYATKRQKPRGITKSVVITGDATCCNLKHINSDLETLHDYIHSILSGNWHTESIEDAEKFTYAYLTMRHSPCVNSPLHNGVMLLCLYAVSIPSMAL